MTNEQMRQNWSSGASGWVQNERLFDAVYAPVTGAILEGAGIGPGDRVLDIGCGTGTLLDAAVELRAQAVGVDISPTMADAARRRVPQAQVLVADAQTADLRAAAPGDPFGPVVSRFGVMFFEDPVAAFANIRSSSAPGARLSFACWRTLAENPVFTLGNTALLDQLDRRPPPIVPGAPGAVAFADPERVRSVLHSAGWHEIDVQPLDFVCDYGFDGTDGVEERLTSVLGTASGRMAREELEPRLGADGWNSLLDDIRAQLRDHIVDGAVQFPGACWLVTAQ